MITVFFLFVVVVVVVFTALSFYTSINSGASKLEKWINSKNKR